MKWATEAQAAFIDSIFPANAPKETQSIPNTMDTAMDFIFTFLLDSVTTQLSNVVLRRRDLILTQANRMRPNLVQEIRSQPILQSSLIVVNKDDCDTGYPV